MTTAIKVPKKEEKKIKTSKKKEEGYKPESLIIHLTSKKQKKVFETLCKALEMNFEFKIDKIQKKEESPYDPEFVKEIRKSEEDFKAGRFYRLKDIKNMWSEEAWEKSESWK